MIFESFQKSRWDVFYKEEIKPLIESCSYSDEDIDIKYEYNKTMSEVKDKNYLKFLTNNDTYKMEIYVDVIINTPSSTGVQHRRTIHLLDIPILTAEGFIVSGNKHNFINTLKLANGWFLKHGKKSNGKQKLSLELRPQYGSGKIEITEDFREIFAVKTVNSLRANITIPLLDWCVALLDLDKNEIQKEIGYDLGAFASYISQHNRSRLDCLKKVYASYKGIKNLDKVTLTQAQLQRFARQLFYDKIILGRDGVRRYQQFISFNRRCFNCTLDDAITLADGTKILANRVLDHATLIKIDEDPTITQLIVRAPQQSTAHTVRKFKSDALGDRVRVNSSMILNTLSVYFGYLEGVGSLDEIDSLQSKVMLSFTEKIGEGIIKKLYSHTKNLRFQYNKNKVFDAGIAMIKSDPESFIYELKTDSFFQLRDDTNTLAENASGYKINSDRRGGNVSVAMRDIKHDHYGRICPLDTSERKDVGLNIALTVGAKVDDAGFITSSLRRVVSGVASEEVYDITSFEEEDKYVVSWDTDLTKPTVNARYNGTQRTVPVSEVSFMEAHNNHILGYIASQIAFIEAEKSKRGLMGVRMKTQGLPIVGAETPQVITGFSGVKEGVIDVQYILNLCIDQYNLYSDKENILSSSIRIDSVENNKGWKIIHYRILNPNYNSRYSFALTNMQGGEKNTLQNYNLNFKENYIYEPNDIVFSKLDIDISKKKYNFSDSPAFKGNHIPDSNLALGMNFIVVFKCYKGLTYEDAVVIREDIVNNHKLSSFKIITKTLEFKTSDDFEESLATPYSTEKGSRYYNYSDGLPNPGSLIRSGEVLVGARRKFLKKVGKNEVDSIKDISLVAGMGEEGYVIHSFFEGSVATVMIGSLKKLQEADKLAGDHGNKGVIAKVVRKEDFPFFSDGTQPHIILNPLGVLARVNPAQLQFALLAMAGYELGEIQVVPSFNLNNFKFVMETAERAGLEPMDMYDGFTGEKYPYKVLKGYLYMMKLNHMVDDKYNALGNPGGNVSQELLQPKNGKKRHGGQRVSELQNWCILACGATDFLSSLQSSQCSDVSSRNAIARGRSKGVWNPDVYGSSDKGLVVKTYMMTVGLDMFTDDNKYSMRAVTDDYITEIANELKVEPNVKPFITLHDPKVFWSTTNMYSKNYSEKRKIWGYLDLKVDIIMPIFLLNKSFLDHFYITSVAIARGEIETKLDRLTSAKARKLIQGVAFIDLETMQYFSSQAVVTFYESNYGKCSVVTGYFGLNAYVTQYTKERLSESTGGVNLDLLYYSDEEEANIDYIYTSGIEIPKPTQMEEGIEYTDNHTNENYKHRAIRSKVTYVDPKDYTVRKVLVMPESFRPEQKGRDDYHDFDKLYSNVMVNMRSEYTEEQFNRMYKFLCSFQQSIDQKKTTQLISITSRLLDSGLDKEKTIFRGFVKGYRVGGSGRSAIRGNPNLKLDEFGMPFVMALEFYQELLAYEIKHSSSTMFALYSAETVKSILEALKNDNLYSVSRIIQRAQSVTIDLELAYATAKNLESIIFTMLQSLLLGKLFTLNREPSLHKFNVKAFKAILIRGKAITLHPMHCTSYNADFDGDLMMVCEAPTKAGQDDLRKNMTVYNNVINPKDNSLIVTHAQDIILGLYYLTMPADNGKFVDKWDYVPCSIFNSVEQMKLSLDFGYIKPSDFVVVNVKTKKDIDDTNTISRNYYSTAGRILFNSYLPRSLGFTSVLEDKYTKDSNYTKLSKEGQDNYSGFFKLGCEASITSKIANSWNNKVYKILDSHQFIAYMDAVKELGVYWCDRSGLTLNAYDFVYREDTAKQTLDHADSVVNSLYELEDMLLITPSCRKQKVIDTWEEANDSSSKIIETELDGPIIYLKGAYKAFLKLDKQTVLDKIKCINPKEVREFLDYLVGEPTPLDTDEDSSYITKDIISYLNYYNKREGISIGGKETAEEVYKYLDKLTLSLQDGIDRNTCLFMLIDSGARGKFSNYTQCVGLAGQVSTTSGDILESPLRGSYISGLGSQDYFMDTFFSRKGVISTAVLTQDSGELTKDIVTMLQDVRIIDHDCGGESYSLRLVYSGLKNKTIDDINSAILLAGDAKITGSDFNALVGLSALKQDLIARSPASYIEIGETEVTLQKILSPIQRKLLYNRVYERPSKETETTYGMTEDLEILDNINSRHQVLIDEEFISTVEDTAVNYISYRSTLNCEHKHGVCQKCYGGYLGSKEFAPIGTFVGIISAQAIGEPSTQLTLNTTHGKSSDKGITGSVTLLKRYVQASSTEIATKGAVYAKEATLYSSLDKSGIHTYRDLDDNFYLRNISENASIRDVDTKIVNISSEKIILPFDNVSNIYCFPDMLAIDYNWGRYRLLEDYCNIFLSQGVDVLPIHFELVTRQQTKFFLITETIGRYPESSIINYTQAKEANLLPSRKEIDIKFAKPKWFNPLKCSLYSGNSFTAMTSREFKSCSVANIVNRTKDDGVSAITAQVVGMDLTSMKILDLDKVLAPISASEGRLEVYVEDEDFFDEAVETYSGLQTQDIESSDILEESIRGEIVQDDVIEKIEVGTDVDKFGSDDDFNYDMSEEDLQEVVLSKIGVS